MCNESKRLGALNMIESLVETTRLSCSRLPQICEYDNFEFHYRKRHKKVRYL